MPASKKTVTDPVLGNIAVARRSDRQVDELRIARARALLARAPKGSKLAALYAEQVNGIASGYAPGTI